jgi:hypothetical protein
MTYLSDLLQQASQLKPKRISCLVPSEENAKETESYFDAEQKLQPQSGPGRSTNVVFRENSP